LSEVVGTIIHEWDHLETGLLDGDSPGRKFRDCADKRIGKLMVDSYEYDLLRVVEGGVTIPLDSISILRGLDYSFENSVSLQCYVLRVGTQRFTFTSTEFFLERDHGIAEQSSDGLSFFIAIPGIVSIKSLKV